MPGGIESSASSDAARKAKIFISYSRKDMAFADRIQAELEARGFEPLVDREEIYAFEDWWARIQALIVKSDTIIFVLSPDAVASEICVKEVAFAASLNKRFAPVVCRRVDDSAIPETLRRLNFIFFDDQAAFDDGITRLVEALETDIDWVRKHTEFGEAARRWSLAGRPGPRGLLLRSPVLEDAESWISSRPHGAPEPTDATQAFVIESRKALTRRRNILTAALSVGLVFALGLLGLAYGAFYNAQQERNDALIGQSEFLAQSAHTAIADGNATLGMLLALAALPKNLSAPDRPFVNQAETALEDALASEREIAVLRAGKGIFDFVRFSSDGMQLLTGAGDNTATIWDATTGRQLKTLSAPETLDWGIFSPDGARVIAGDNDHWYGWDAATGRQIFALDGRPSFSADGRRAWVALHSAWEVRDAETGALIQTPPGFSPITLSPDGKTVLMFGQRDSRVQLWNVDTSVVTDLSAVVRTSYYGDEARFTTDSTRLILWSGSTLTDGQFITVAKILDVATGAQIASLQAPRGGRLPPDITADNARVIMAVDMTAYLFDANSATVTGSFSHAAEITTAAFSPDGKRIVTVSSGRVRLGDAITGDEIVSLRGATDKDEPPSAIFSRDGKRLLVAFDAKSTQLIDAENGAQIARLDGTVRSTGNPASTPDNRSVITGSNDGSARIWDLASGRLLALLRDNEGNADPQVLQTAALSPDGSRAITRQLSNVRIWSTDPLAAAVLRGHTGAVFSAAFSPDGTRLATASADQTARIWNVKTRGEFTTLRGHEGEVYSVAFSPDGKLVATASADKTARIWDAASGTQLRVLAGHEGAVRSAAFSPDGKRIVTASDDKTVRIWDAASGDDIMVFRGHDGPVRSAVFSSDGSRVLSAGRPYPIIWEATTGQIVKPLKRLMDLPGQTAVTWSKISANETPGVIALMRQIEAVATSQGLRLGSKSTFASFSPDGTEAVGALFDWLVEVWDVDTGVPNLIVYFPVPVRTWSARFSEDGRYIVTASADGTTRIWSIDRDRPWTVLSAEIAGNNDDIYSAAFSPDGKSVVTAGADGTARIWNAPHCQDAIDRARLKLPRQLSDLERLQAFLNEQRPSASAAFFAAVRRWFAFALPAAGDTCE